MGKYITEKTLRTIQIAHAITERQENRQLWIELASKIAHLFDFYCLVKNTSTATDVDLLGGNFEKFIMLTNEFLGTDFGLSDFNINPDQNADEAILYYKTYKELMNIFDSDNFNAKVAEKLFDELYSEQREYPAHIIIYSYYGKIGEQILEYVCGRIDYDAFMQKILAIKMVPNQRPIDGSMLKNMIETGEKWVTRYIEILREERAKGNIK